MDTEKQKSSPGGTVPGEKVPPVLMAEDVAALEELCGDVSGYFYKMLDYLDQRVRDGVRQGEFTEEQARGDLDLALWYAYACNNIDDYDYYYKAAQWMPASEPAAEAASSVPSVTNMFARIIPIQQVYCTVPGSPGVNSITFLPGVNSWVIP